VPKLFSNNFKKENTVAVSREELEAELENIVAAAEERAEFTRATEERAKFLDDPLNEFGHGFTTGISSIVGAPVDIVDAMLNAGGLKTDAPFGSGESIQDVLAELQNMPEGIPMEPQGIVGGAGEGLGVAAIVTPLMLAPFMKAAMDPNLDQRQGEETRKFHGGEKGSATRIPRSRAARVAFLLKQVGEKIAQTAVKHPKTFIASEAAASMAAGAGMQAAEERGIGPQGQMAVGLGAGTVAGLSPAAIPRMVKNAWRWGMKHFNPFRKSGAMPRAAEQMQLRAEDATAAADKLAAAIDPETGQLLPEFEGMTPARIIGEERLMAQEARVLADDPELDKLVREDLVSAIKRAEFELRGLYDTPQGKEAWEQAVFQRVAPDSVEITPGTAEEMLDQLYKAFTPMYEEFKGYPIRTGLYNQPRRTSLEVMINNVPETNRVMVDDATRAKVGRWLDSQYEGLHRTIKQVDGVDTFQSGDLLEFRSAIRAEARKAAKRQDMETVDLLKIAEEKVDVLLKDQLPEGTMAELGIVDSHYRNYKIAEDAVYRGAAGDRGLTPDSLLQSVRASASSKGAYARGEQLELRSLAATGRPISKLLNDPERIRRSVANMTEADLTNTQQDFFDTMLGKSMITDDQGVESLSGIKLKKTLQNFDEAAKAVRMDEGAMTRANTIADRLIMAQRPHPSPVGELYEDAPADILQLIATLIGAKHGQKVAGRGMGSSLVVAGFFAKKARDMLGKLTTNQARIILANSQTDPQLYNVLLTSAISEPASQAQAAQYLKAYLAEVTQRGLRQMGDKPDVTNYMEELERLRELEAAQ
jgi:hypothetical protein